MTQHWHQHKDPRTLELMQHTIQHQLTQALEQSRTEGQLQYAAWIRQGEAKGLRGLFRNLKASELAWQRPYRTVPMADRMRHRLHDWHQHWQPTSDNTPLNRDSLRDQACTQAAQLPPLTLGHLARVLKQLPDRACGPDAISTQLLRNTPPQALPSLLQLLQDMEKSATLPTQLQMSLMVMLAKNEKVERPITLTSVLYRTWCRLRKGMLDTWQLNLPPSMDYDRARPGATALHVALERLLRQESNKTLALHGITVLLDMSTFYDTIDLQKLQTVAQALEYPPLALEFAMQVYTGPKAVLADAELSHWFHVTHGVAAGCPQAPLLAKAFLQPILSPFQAQHPDLHLNGWVDDIGFDGKHHNPDILATRIVHAWQELRQALSTAGLKVNNHKTAFIVTDKATHRALAKLLGPDDPPIQSVMRDLGIDHQAGRRRRITTLQNRFKKNKQRRIKLRTLRLPSLRTRLRLHRGGIQPVALWGVEGQGLAPRYRQALRQALATHLGLHSGGITDVVYDQHQTKYMDPADQVVIQHVQALHALINRWPTDHLPHIERAWMELQSLLRRQQYPWYHVKGPMAATLAYLREWGWQTNSLYEWHRNETAFMTAAQIDLRQPWWQVEELLHAEARQQRQHRFASRRNCQSLVSGLDWTTASKATKSLTKAQATHIRTWNQAAIRFKDGTNTKPCPICQVPATPKHIIWLCKWHHNQKHTPLPIPWTERLQDPLEEPLWAYGWIPKEPQDHLTQPLDLEGHGCWQSLEPLPLQPWQGLSVTVDATPTSGDKRAQAWIYALCIHGYSLGALQRKGTITGMAKGPQTKARAIFQGLITLAQYIQTPTRVIVQVSSVWEAWNNPAKRKGFHDLVQGHPSEYFTLITPLYVPKNHKTPDAPGSEPHLRQRQRDAALAAWERATSIHNPDKEAWQRILDQDHLEIYQHAGARLAKIYEDKEHYLHTKPGRATAHKTKQRKKTLIAQCQQPWQPGKHQWKAHRSGYQCHTCQTRVHQGLTAAMIEERLQEDCDQLTAPAPEPDLPPDRAVGKKPTRASRIAALLQLQQEHPTTPDVHHLQETTGYLKCTKCNQAIHKRANEELFNQFLHSTCIDAPFGQEHAAHNTHTLWQIGKSIQCKGCGLHTHLDAQDRLILTKGLQRECKGHKPTSPTLAHFFSQTNPQGRTTPPERSLSTARATTSPITGHDTQPTADSEAAAPTGSDALSPPMPKKLRFSAEMQPATQEPSATSTEEAEEEVDMAHDPEVTVDYF